MWLVLMMVCLWTRDEARPVPGELHDLHDPHDLQDLQEQLSQMSPSAGPDHQDQDRQRPSSSSSSSSSSQSSQSSEETLQLKQTQNLDDMAVEQMDSEEILDQVRFRSNRTQASPWSDGLVLLGRPQTHTDSHEDTGDDSDQDQHRTLLLSLHHLFSRSRHQAVGGASAQEGGVLTHGGAMSAAAVGGAEPDFDQGSEEGLTSDLQHYSHHHGYDTEEAGLVLGL
ncbi:uncharacterized protein LOC115415934 isoform X1 [Sphaeramia orbicularis]|uniref:uncharacterized protein LOC115415934 isoform X1 n=1 Tax=Sphaeramia orbicularis TaxID=375764 RepID=UPI00117D9951|nr:uncharacterized protein LOC115415934 isoform X1 [Sphaeramia orbicularis]